MTQARRVPGVAAAAFLFCLAADASPAKRPKVEPLADHVQDWWVMNGGKTLVALKKVGFSSCPAAAGYLKLLHKSEGVRGCSKLDEKTIGYEIGGQRYALLDVAAGRETTAVSGPGSYRPCALKPGRDWFVLLRVEPKPANSAFFRVEIANAKSRRVYETKDKWAVELVRIRDGERKLIVSTASEQAGTMIQRTVDLYTRQVTVKKVPRGVAEAPPSRTSSYVLKASPRRIVEEDGRLWIQVGRKRMAMFREPGREWSLPDQLPSPTCLIVPRLVDSNKDGKIAREDGDRIEVWLVDLADGKQTRIADASRENVTRGWTPDGKYFLFNQIVAAPDESQWRGDLVIFRKADRQPMRFQPGPNTNYVSYHGQVEPGRLLICYSLLARDRRRQKMSHFALLELGKDPVIRLVGHGFAGPRDGQIAGRALIYAVQDPKTKTSRLFRCPLPPPLTKWERSIR